MDSYEREVRVSNSRKAICNSQICLAYLFSFVASIIIVHGFYLGYKHRSRTWLILPCIGVILIFIGSCMYKCGSVKIYAQNYGVNRRKRNMSKRATIGSQFFESQLSLNMLPQCFSNTNSSRMLNSNGHRYLILPIDSNSSPSSDIQFNNPISISDNETSNRNTSESNSEQNQELSQVEEAVSRIDESLPDLSNGQSQNETIEDNNFTQAAQIRSSVSSTENVPSRVSSSSNDLVNSYSIECASVDGSEVVHFQNSLIELDTVESDISANSTDESAPVNEAPPTYEEVIDFDSSVILIDNYRTL